MRFDGKVVFVTGGAIGFGRPFARALVAEGAAAVIAEKQAAETN